MELKDRIKEARVHMKLSQSGLAERSHTSQVIVSKIELGQTLQPRKIEQFAKVLDVPPEWLLYGANPPRWSKESDQSGIKNMLFISGIKEVPIIPWHLVSEFCDHRSELNDFEFIICPDRTASNKTFAIRVLGDSMTSPYGRSYQEGCILFVDTQKMPMSGSRVIAKTSKGYTFKELAKNEFGEQYLKSLNTTHQPIFDAEIKVCGVVIASYLTE